MIGTTDYVYATGTGAPSSTGTLSKSSGTGDSSITFTAFSPTLPSSDGSLLTGISLGMTKVQSGSFNTASSFTISGLTAGAKYRLFLIFTQNTISGVPSIQFNADGGANYGWYTSAGTGQAANGLTNMPFGCGPTVASGYLSCSIIDLVPMNGASNQEFVFASHNILSSGSYLTQNQPWGGFYNGAAGITSMTIATSAGTFTGSWTLYQIA